MSRRARIWLGTAVLAAALTAVLGSAVAFFTSGGAGEASAAVTSLAKPTISSATPAVGGSVTIAWGAVTPPQSGTVTYYVSRDGEAAAGTCPTAASPAALTSCVDKEVEPGAHSYEVTAVWRSWKATSNPKSATVAIGAATHLVLVAASTTPLAGAVDNLTISAKDANGTTVTSYAGTKNLVFAGAAASPGGTAPTVVNSAGSAVTFGATTTISFTNGVAAVASSKNGVMKLYRAGAANVTVGDGSLTTETPLALTVSTAAISKFVLAAESTTPAPGAADDLTITAQDTYANVITTYTGSKSLTFTGASASPGGNVPTVTDAEGNPVAFGTATPIEFEAGVATTSGSVNGEMRLYKSGATTVKVAEGSISATLVVTPPPAAAAKLALSATPVSGAAGTSISLTQTAQDAYGNTATSYTGSKSLTFSGAAASPSGSAPVVVSSAGTAVPLGTATPITFTNGVSTVSASKNGVLKIYKAGAAAITVSDGSISNATPLALTVSTAAISKFVLAAESTTPAPGAADDLTITAQDTYANVITTYTGSKSLTFTGASASPGGNVPTVTDAEGNPVAFGSATPIEFEAGVATTSGSLNGEMRLYKSGATTVKVAEGSISATLVVTPPPAAAAKFLLAGTPLSVAAGASVNLTITAQDGYGNTAASYTGSKTLVFSGPGLSPGGTAATVANSAGTAVPIGAETAITFTNGVATISSTKNGVFKPARAGINAIAVGDGTISSAAPLSVTVTPTTAAKLAFTELVLSRGALSATCYFTCTVSGLGESGTISGEVAVTDTYGNVNSNIGSGHSVAVTTTAGTVSGGAIALPATGAAEAPSPFLLTAPATGSYSATLKAATSAGTAYANATATVNK